MLGAIKISRAPMAGLTAVGMIWGAFAALVPTLKSQVGASDAQFGIALIFASIGGMIAMYITPKMEAKLNRFALPLIGIIGVLTMLAVPYLSQNITTLYIALTAMGFSVALLDMTSNIRISHLEDRHSTHLMNVNHAMFSFGFAGAAVLAGLLVQNGLTYHTVVPICAAISGLIVAFTFEAHSVSNPALDAKNTEAQRLPWVAIILTAVILFATFIGENSIDAWSALFLERDLGAASGEGSLGPFMLGLVMGIGRLAGQVVAEKIGEIRLVLWSGILGTLGAFGLASAQNVSVAVGSIALIALGLAVIVPTANSILGKFAASNQRGLAISRAWLLGFTGFFIGPSVIGFIAEAYSLRVAFYFVAVMISLVIPAVLILKTRRQKETQVV